MEFCPTCGMLLQYELPHMDSPARFFCPTCPYVCHIDSKVKIKRKHRLVKKELDPIISKDDELDNLPETEGWCRFNLGKASLSYLVEAQKLLKLQ
ncbi:DNA-directed RNA polymerase III subunit RPC10-like isoform X2 [Coffea arabica]|uniref:DNA-directed RNA polymerase III subunit RPC10-like isoform X2 n=1 Tax=Coffea arabica TaxID=13443 RepID=A0ABM4UR22_COFAR